MAVLMQSAEV